MKRKVYSVLWAVAFFLSTLAFPKPAQAITPTYIQGCANAQGSGSGSISCTMTIGAQHLIAVGIDCYNGCQQAGLAGGFFDTFGISWNWPVSCSKNFSGPGNENVYIVWGLTGSNSVPIPSLYWE